MDDKELAINSFFFLFFFYSRWTSSLPSCIADGPHHYHPACGHKGSSHLSPVHALQFFYRDASSALLQLVNQWLNFTYSRSHAFRYERKNTNPTKVRIELTTSALAGNAGYLPIRPLGRRATRYWKYCDRLTYPFQLSRNYHPAIVHHVR